MSGSESDEEKKRIEDGLDSASLDRLRQLGEEVLRRVAAARQSGLSPEQLAQASADFADQDLNESEDPNGPEVANRENEEEDDGWGGSSRGLNHERSRSSSEAGIPDQSPDQQQTPGLIQMTIPVGMLQCNCTVIGDPLTREALVVDPGDEVGRILELLGRHKLVVKAIVSTHAHIDHVGGLAKLHEYTGAPLLMHRDDLPLYRAMEMQAAFLGVAPPPITGVDHLLKEGDPLRWGLFEATVIHTPGHTPGSICLYMPNVGMNLTMPRPRLFSGDTLFAGSIGRTDLWGGSLEQLMDSLRGKIMELPDHTEVFPGHGAATVIGEERQSNPFLRG